MLIDNYARLIRESVPQRNNDSNAQAVEFDCCASSQAPCGFSPAVEGALGTVIESQNKSGI
jgi:hypothetical protein